MCETGAARRSWLRGLVDVGKRYLIHAAGHNLGVVMRAVFGIGTPRSLQGQGDFAPALVFTAWCRLYEVLIALWARWPRSSPSSAPATARPARTAA
jgi:transposase